MKPGSVGEQPPNDRAHRGGQVGPLHRGECSPDHIDHLLCGIGIPGQNIPGNSHRHHEQREEGDDQIERDRPGHEEDVVSFGLEGEPDEEVPHGP